MVVIDLGNVVIDIKEWKKGINNRKLILESLNQKNKIDDVLHVITVISNVCEFKKRWKLMQEFIERMEKTPYIKLYVVELVYENQEFHITNPNNPYHLQIKTNHALWHKENMINIGINKLLPKDWKAVAWIDGDIEFENPNWALDTLKVLTNFEIVQLFTTCFDLDETNNPMSIWQSYGYKYCNGKDFKHERGLNYWHCGYAWACTREYYDKIGGLYDKGILGSGDYILTQSILKNCANISVDLEDFKLDIIRHYQYNFLNQIKVGYIPTNILHYYHGSKINRKYIERNTILLKYSFNPILHLEYNSDTGVLEPTEAMSDDFINDIKTYFFQRNEDE